MRIEPYRIRIADEVLQDLQTRLDRARLPDEVAGAGWRYGVDAGFMEELISYWRRRFDWRLQEQTLTTLEPRATTVTDADGQFRFTGQPAHHFVLVAEKPGVGATPRLPYRRYFRGQNLVLREPLRLEPRG